MQDIAFDKLSADAEIIVPMKGDILTFDVDKITMDKDFIWSIGFKFNDYFTTLETAYNIVVFPNPMYFQDSIDAIIRKYNNNQTTLEDIEPGAIVGNVVDDINAVIKKWRENVAQIGVVNILGQLEKYERKLKSKDMSFCISAKDVDFWKDDYKTYEKYCICLEKTDTHYDPHQLFKNPLEESDYIITV